MLNVTAKAAAEMRRMMSVQRCPEWGVRVGVRGGGCSDLSYTMSFEEGPGQHDRVFESDGVRFFCDPKSYLYLNGLMLDYSDEIVGGGFRFVHPSADRVGCAS